MCGIVGYIGKKHRAQSVLLDGLRRLEYRGYDSAGIAFHDEKKVISCRAQGKVAKLEQKVLKTEKEGVVGIAHTRWATHGKPSVRNAHPHRAGKIHLVHNGIIENYSLLKKELEKKGHVFTSDTDTEVIAHLIEQENKKYDFEHAVIRAAAKLQGAYGIVVMHADEPQKLIALRESSPLVLGIGKEAFILASDASAIVSYTKRVVYIDDGEMVVLTPHEYHVENMERIKQNKSEEILQWDEKQAQKEGYAHFMLKEIHDQPHSIADAMRGRIDVAHGTVKLGGLASVSDRLRDIKRVIFVSCGTSYNAGLVGEYMFEEFSGIPTEVEYASEFRYRTPIVDENTAVIAISQSGETADTLAAVREAKSQGALTLGIVNAVGSTIARETDAGIYNHAGPEIGVASTKAFTSQLVILALFAVLLGRQRSLSLVRGKEILAELAKIPKQVEAILTQEKAIKKLAKKYAKYENFFYLGRKYNYPIAIEGALKIKEISYVHAESYPMGELKHGPIALIDKQFPSVVLAPKDSVYDKTLSGIEEIKARSGKVLVVTTEGAKEVKRHADDVIILPQTIEMLTPLLAVIPLQVFSYYVGVSRGLDVDQPRNLAKSVTVE